MKHTGKNVVEVPTVMHNWASLNHRLGKHSEAEELYNKSLILREKYLGHRNTEVASSLISLAAVKVLLNHYEDARGLYSRALTMLKDIIGEDHQAVAYTSTRLGVLLETQKCYDEAIQHFAEALVIDDRVYGERHEQVQRSIGRIQRAALKHAQTLHTSKQLVRWKAYIEELLKKYRFKWPERTGPDSRTGFAVDTSADLLATPQSISVAIDPEASGPSDIKTETTTSFQGFAPAVKDHTGVDLDSTLHLNSSALQLNVDSASRGPPGLPRTAGAYSADPPSQEASGMKRYSSTDIPKASSSIMGSSQNSELNFGQYSGQLDGNQTMAHAYSLVHDNSQFGVANTSSLETTISPRANQDIAYPIPAS